MSFRLLNISSMYPGNLKTFYSEYPCAIEFSYEDHYRLLMEKSTEFAGSYYRNFIKAGVDARCIIGNDTILQSKWKREGNSRNISNNELLHKQIETWKPEILWIEDINSLSCEWISSIRQRHQFVRLIAAYHCSPFNMMILKKLKGVDFVVTCTPGLKQSMEREGIKSFLVYHGFDSDMGTQLRTSTGTPRKNVVFSGSLFTGGELHNARINLVERILEEDTGLELFVNLESPYKIRIKQVLFHLTKLLRKLGMNSLVKVIPVLGYSKEPIRNYSKRLINSSKGPVFGTEMYNLFTASRIVLNIHLGMAGDYAGNMRLFEVTGAGSCLLTDNKKNIGDLFVPGKEVAVYDNAEDCVGKIKWLLEHEEERHAIAIAGNRRTLNDHTVERRCRQIIEIIDSELNRP